MHLDDVWMGQAHVYTMLFALAADFLFMRLHDLTCKHPSVADPLHLLHDTETPLAQTPDALVLLVSRCHNRLPAKMLG